MDLKLLNDHLRLYGIEIVCENCELVCDKAPEPAPKPTRGQSKPQIVQPIKKRIQKKKPVIKPPAEQIPIKTAQKSTNNFPTHFEVPQIIEGSEIGTPCSKNRRTATFRNMTASPQSAPNNFLNLNSAGRPINRRFTIQDLFEGTMNTPHKIEEIHVQSNRKDYIKGSPCMNLAFVNTALPLDFDRDPFDALSFDCGRSSAYDNVAFKDLPSHLHTPVNVRKQRDRSTAKKLLDFEVMQDTLSFLDNPFFSDI